MTSSIDLNELDVNGDVRETAEAAGLDRSTFLKAGAIGLGGAAFFGLPDIASATISTTGKSARNDLKIANFALMLERLGHTVYKTAVDQDQFASPELKQFAQVVESHEAGHVKLLEKALGSKAARVPTLNTAAIVAAIAPERFAVTATMLEDNDTAALAGQGPNLNSRELKVMALGFHSVEARHSSWIRFIRGGGQVGAAQSLYPAPATFDRARTQGQVLRAVAKTGFVSSYDKSKI